MSFMPRLVVHKDEIHQIFYPQKRALNVAAKPVSNDSNENNDEPPTNNLLEPAVHDIEQVSSSSDMVTSKAWAESIEVFKAELSANETVTDSIDTCPSSCSSLSNDNVNDNDTCTLADMPTGATPSQENFKSQPIVKEKNQGEGRRSTAGRFLPPNPSNIPGALLNRASEVPGVIYQFAMDMPATISNISMQIPLAIAQIANDVPVNIAQLSSEVAREVAHLPHRASHNWRQLIWVLFLLVVGALVLNGVIFFVPLSPVDEGLEHNRSFVYGVMTYYEILTLIPWIETCNFAMPDANIPIKARVSTLVIALSMHKVIDALITEAWWWPGHTIFPIPFSIFLSGSIAFFCIVPLLGWMTPNSEAYPFRLLFLVLFNYWFSLAMIGFWAIGMRCLMGKPILQICLGGMYGPLRFMCKILVSAQLTTLLCPTRWIMLNMVVDIFFTRVQIATYPYIDNGLTVMLLFTTEVLTIVWRYYGGVDRLALWWMAISSKKFYLLRKLTQKLPKTIIPSRQRGSKRGQQEPNMPDNPCIIVNDQLDIYDDDCECDINLPTNTIYAEFGNTITGITLGCFLAPIRQIAQLQLQVLQDVKSQKLRSSSAETFFGSSDLEIDELSSDSNGPLSCLNDKNNPLTSETTTELDAETGDATSHCMNDQEQPTSPSQSDAETKNKKFVQTAAAVATSMAELRDVGLAEEHWEQRPLYHLIDSVGSMVVSIIVRLSQQICILLARVLPIADHLNDSFEVTDERWKYSQIYGWSLIALMIILLGSIEVFYFRRIQKLGERQLTLSRIMSYMFRDHFWFFFLWLVASGACLCTTMINHFGVDFTMQFTWTTCPKNHMNWPGCIE